MEKPAFLIGNGINYHKDFSFSWTNLLKNLLPSGYFSSYDDDLSLLLENVIKKLDSDNSILFENAFLSANDNYKIKKIISMLLKKQGDNFCQFMDGLTYPEIAELALHIGNYSIGRLKNKIAENIIEIENKFINDKHNNLLEFAYTNNLPILTTNYDLALQKSNDDIKIKNNFSWIEFNRKRDASYLSNGYFRHKAFNRNNKNLNVSKEFAIWHIHGAASSSSYRNSIKITNKDYANQIKRLSTSINYMKKYNCSSEWRDYYSWIKILMTNDLVIAGLGLESSEMDLRWILIERFNYHSYLKRVNKNYKIPETIFIYTDTIPNGTKQYFEKLNVKTMSKEYFEVFNFSDFISIKNI